MSPLYKTLRYASVFVTKRVLINTFTNRLENVISFRNFNKTTQFRAKIFMEYENSHAYSIMESQGYATPIINYMKSENSVLSEEEFRCLLKSDWSKKSPKELFQSLAIFGVYSTENKLCISNKIFDEYIDNLTDNIKYASDKELKEIFYALKEWPETPSPRTRNYIEVWAALDDECVSRMKNNWSYEELLNYAALFFMLSVTKMSDFSNKCLQKCATRAKNLTPPQLVQTMFYIGVMRKPPFDMHSLEIQLDNQFSEFTIDDLAIMSMGFFKSKTPIRDQNLIKKIIDKTIQSSATVHEVSLAALLKVIRYSCKSIEDDRIYRLLDTLQHEVPRLSVMCIVHIALLGTFSLTLHRGCLTKIADHILNNLPTTRLKDLERLVLTYGSFNIIPATKENFIEKIIHELGNPRHTHDIELHGKSFACCVSYFSLLGFYPIELMGKVLSPEFLLKTYGKQCHGYGREILTIHNVAEIFCEGADINRLTPKEAIILAKRYTDYVPHKEYKKQYNITERMFIDVMDILQQDRGNDFVTGDHILTHHSRGDIILCNDHNGSPVPVVNKFPSSGFGLIRRPIDDNTWIVLVVAGRNAIIYNEDVPSGHFLSKVKELNKIGYHSAVVLWSKYNKLQTKEEKTIYLNNLIKEALNKNNVP